MLARNLKFLNPFLAVLVKDIFLEFRTRYSLNSLAMFALITLTSVSMTIGTETLSSKLTAVLLWITLFFSAMAGLARSFVQEVESGTIFVLRLYGGSQAVLFGKMLFNIIMLLALACLIVPLFLVFLRIEINLWGYFFAVLLFGLTGIAAASTLTASMLVKAEGRGALFTVLTFPVLLPQFLASISSTAKILENNLPGTNEIIFLLGYDLVLIIAASILFDYLWYD